MSSKANNFDFKAWHNQIAAEKRRLETELDRVGKLTEVLASFISDQEPRVNHDPEKALQATDPMDSEFEQLTTINKKIQLLYFLLDVVRTFSAEVDNDRRLALISEKASQLLNADRSAIFLIDNATKEICAKIPEGASIKETRFSKDLGVIGYVAKTGRTLNVPDTQKDVNFRSEIDERPAYNAKNLIVTPLRDNTGNIFGVLEVLNKVEGRFTPDDEYLLQAFAAQAAMSIKYEAPGVGAPPLVSNPLLLIMKALSGGLGIDNLLQSLMKKTTQVMNADRSTLFLIDFDTNEIWSKVAEGTGVSEIRFPLGIGVAGYVIQTASTLNIQDAYRDSRFNSQIDARTGYVTRTILCAPLKDDNGKILGVLQVLNKREGKFTEKDEILINAFTFQVSKVVRSSQFVLNLLTMLENDRSNAR